MATSSIFESVKISDPKVADSFVRAIEESEKFSRPATLSADFQMATHEDIIKLHEMRKQRRNAVG